MQIFLCLRKKGGKSIFVLCYVYNSLAFFFKHFQAHRKDCIRNTRTGRHTPLSHPRMTLVHPFRRHVPAPSVNRDCLEIGLLFYFRKQFASVIKKFPRVTPSSLSFFLSLSLGINPFFFLFIGASSCLTI